MSLNNLSIRLADAGRRDEALAAITEAVDIRRRLAAANPAAFLPDLAMSLNNLSIGWPRRAGGTSPRVLVGKPANLACTAYTSSIIRIGASSRIRTELALPRNRPTDQCIPSSAI